MDNDKVLNRVLTRIDNFDDKLEKKTDSLHNSITKCNGDINQCKIEIQGVQKDLTNHLENEKKETEGFKRRIYYAVSFLGTMFGSYAILREFF